MRSWLVCMFLCVFIDLFFVTNLQNFHSVLREDDPHILSDNDELNRKVLVSRETCQRLYYSFFLKDCFIIFCLK